MLISAVIPMTVARSGLVAVAVGLTCYAVHLPNRARLNLAILGVIGLGLYRAMARGLLQTMKGLLLIGEDDPSIAGRTADYAKIPGLIAGFEAFGRGIGTFDPTLYFYLDNQYLGSLLEGGVLGVTTLIITYVVGFGVARGVRHRAVIEACVGQGKRLRPASLRSGFLLWPLMSPASAKPLSRSSYCSAARGIVGRQFRTIPSVAGPKE